MHEPIEKLGPVTRMPPLAKLLKYAGLLHHVFKKLDWNPSEFDAYRVRIQYPVLHTELQFCASSEVKEGPHAPRT